MTSPTVTGIALDDAQVGVQADIIHGDVTVYQLPPDASPTEQFHTAVRYLDARMPAKASHLIEEAVAGGHDNHEVQFHRLLALLSGRTLRQLSTEDLDRLAGICGQLSQLDGNGQWTVGLRTVLRLLSSLDSAADDLVISKLDRVPQAPRDKIFDHLGVLLEGHLQDRIWRRSVAQARSGQLARDRMNRIWMFFHPSPVPPRVRPVTSAATTAADWLCATVGAVGFLIGLGLLGDRLLRHGDPQPILGATPILGALAALVGLAAFAVSGAEWHFRSRRLRAKEAELRPPPPRRAAPNGGFARRMDRLFDHYFGRYLPRNADHDHWLAETAGIRTRLRDELVEIYREQPVEADRVAWLVRYLVSDVRQRWEKNTLAAHRFELRTPLATRARCGAGLALAITGGGWAGVAAALAAPVTGTAALLITVSGAIIGIRAGFGIHAEHRRVRADESDRRAQLAARREAYARWQAKLSRKPSDAEIAGWLECDRKILVDEVMRHYRLRPSQVIAHAFIEAPGGSYKRARVRGGPWRYSRYRLLLFLLTDDGVRQVDVELNLETASSGFTQRLNYRFDAVASVRIDGVVTQEQTLELSLISGDPIRVRVTESSVEQIQPGEDAMALSQLAIDASGLASTLNVLEGIAAEGKEWIRHQRRRADERLVDLTTVIRKVID